MNSNKDAKNIACPWCGAILYKEDIWEWQCKACKKSLKLTQKLLDFVKNGQKTHLLRHK